MGMKNWCILIFVLLGRSQVTCCSVSVFLPDPTFTLHNVTAVLESVEVDWRILAQCLGVPTWQLKMDPYSTPEEYRKAVIHYYLTTSPYATWQGLAGVLSFWEEARALKAIQKYIHRSAG